MSLRIVFMGTPDFAVTSLNEILKNNIDVAGIITAPDKPAGRGKKMQASAVKQFALENNISKIFQPTNLKDPEFLKELEGLKAELFVVVAFRMLPEVVWSMPPKGTINLHGSLLPDYRGAAPINWAVINGEKQTGATTFFIRHEIDTGNIIDQCIIDIEEHDTAGTVHDKLMVAGAELLVQTINKIFKGTAIGKPQSELEGNHPVKTAPKIFKDDCRINWDQHAKDTYNFIRGLSPYPAAWTVFNSDEFEPLIFKIFDAEIVEQNSSNNPGEIDYSEPGTIKISCRKGTIKLTTIQTAGKKRMDTKAFLLGFSNKEKYSLAT
jgi:methionyl-tRNA formyltransferase